MELFGALMDSLGRGTSFGAAHDYVDHFKDIKRRTQARNEKDKLICGHVSYVCT